MYTELPSFLHCIVRDRPILKSSPHAEAHSLLQDSRGSTALLSFLSLGAGLLKLLGSDSPHDMRIITASIHHAIQEARREHQGQVTCSECHWRCWRLRWLPGYQHPV